MQSKTNADEPVTSEKSETDASLLNESQLHIRVDKLIKKLKITLPITRQGYLDLCDGLDKHTTQF